MAREVPRTRSPGNTPAQPRMAKISQPAARPWASSASGGHRRGCDPAAATSQLAGAATAKVASTTSPQHQSLGPVGWVPHVKDRPLTVLCLDAAGASRLGHYPNERTAGELRSLGELSWSARKSS